jgi:hypothetical protein
MKERHGSGKWLDWFDDAEWSIVTLTEAEFRHLIFLDSDWTRQERLTQPGALNYRILETVARNAITTEYLDRASRQHRDYYAAMVDGYRIAGDDRVLIRAAHEPERAANPAGSYYLMDGAGRGLPYMMLLQERLAYEPVEAFLAMPTSA